MYIRQETLVSKALKILNVGRIGVPRMAIPILCVIAISALGACASTADKVSINSEKQSTDIPYEINDPYEEINRKVFAFNTGVDKAIFKPIVGIYTLIPQWGRDRVTEALDNLGEPVNFVNNVLQGETDRAGATFMRFAINSTIGIVGLFDVAEEWGIEYAPEDFGQTAAVWGMGEGPYVVLPLFGPSNPRDGLGLVTDFFIDPMGYVLTNDQSTIRFIGNAIDQRAAFADELDTLEKTSVDFYAAMREAYRQYRNAEISNSSLPRMIPIPTITIDENQKLPQTAGESEQHASSEVAN